MEWTSSERCKELDWGSWEGNGAGSGSSTLPPRSCSGACELRVVVGRLMFVWASRRFPDGPVTWSVAKPFDPTRQKYVDVVGSGKAIAVEFTGTLPFRIAGYKPEIMPLGRF